MKKYTAPQIKEIVGFNVTKKRGTDNTFIVRVGFFYTGRCISDTIAERVMNKLDKAGVYGQVVEHGEVWKPFKGGAPLAKQSHWYVEIDIIGE